MREFLRIFITLVWSLWFGGIIGLFVFVSTLFINNREIASQAAPQLFHVFEKYQLILAAITLVGTFAWRMMVASRRIVIIFALLSVATVGAVFETTKITPKIDALHAAGRTHTPEFDAAHHLSRNVYSGEAMVLFAAGVLLLIAPAKVIPPTSR